MGYSIDRTYDLWIPEAILPAVVAVARAAYVKVYETYEPSDGLQAEGLSDQFVEVVESLYGEAGDLHVKAGVHKGTPGITVTGMTWGKSTWDDDALTDEFAKLGVHGTIDCIGEDQRLWRERLFLGHVEVSKGIIAYPNDPFYAYPAAVN